MSLSLFGFKVSTHVLYVSITQPLARCPREGRGGEGRVSYSAGSELPWAPLPFFGGSSDNCQQNQTQNLGRLAGSSMQLSPTQEHLADSPAGAPPAFPDMPPITRHSLPYKRAAAIMTPGLRFSLDTSRHPGDWCLLGHAVCSVSLTWRPSVEWRRHQCP